MKTCYLAQDPKFIEELLLGIRQEAPIIVTTAERAHKYPDKKRLLGLCDIITIQYSPSRNMLFCLSKAEENVTGPAIDHSDLIDRIEVTPNTIVAGETDKFITINAYQLYAHYFTHFLLILETEMGLSLTMGNIVLSERKVKGYPVFEVTVAADKTWDALNWSPMFFVNGHIGFRTSFITDPTPQIQS